MSEQLALTQANTLRKKATIKSKLLQFFLGGITKYNHAQKVGAPHFAPIYFFDSQQRQPLQEDLTLRKRHEKIKEIVC